MDRCHHTNIQIKAIEDKFGLEAATAAKTIMNRFKISKSTTQVPTGLFSPDARIVSVYIVETGCRRQRLHCGSYPPRDADRKASELPLNMPSAKAVEVLRPGWAAA